jgi:hypothetical protein
MNEAAYTPKARTAAILDRAYDLVKSVPYQVSARWLFYQLLQEGYYKTKADYKNQFSKAVSNARRAFYKDWRPDTLVDDRREVITRGDGFTDGAEWLEAVARAECSIDKWQSQPVYLECWYEANAMSAQFEYYTRHVTLRPMGGQPSIPYKWRAAKELERAAGTYGKPIKVLYFGDLDSAGETISQTIERDVRTWSAAPFEFIRCGLTLEQVRQYDVPENIDKPGAYQWEALSDTGANEIITGYLTRLLRLDAFTAAERREKHAARWLTDTLTSLLPQFTEA